jgi:hypothetical protein
MHEVHWFSGDKNDDIDRTRTGDKKSEMYNLSPRQLRRFQTTKNLKTYDMQTYHFTILVK